jgi:hypothetical protein
MVGRFFDRPLTWAGFLHLLAHSMQVVGCRDDRKKQNHQAGKRKGKVQGLRRSPLLKPNADGWRYQQKPAKIQHKFHYLVSVIVSSDPIVLREDAVEQSSCYRISSSPFQDEPTNLRTTLKSSDQHKFDMTGTMPHTKARDRRSSNPLTGRTPEKAEHLQSLEFRATPGN